MATNTLLGIFDDPQAARRALERLQSSGLAIDDVSIVSRATTTGAAVSNADDVSAGEGAAVGAVWGGLIGLAALLIPGIGPLVAFGALGAALTGAVAGAVVGGISAALIDFSGITEAEARHYESEVQAGRTLVAVKVGEADAVEARRILVADGATSVRDNQTGMADGDGPVHVSMYDSAGQSVNRAAEYGTPNPTTVNRDTTPDLPDMHPTANTTRPAIENTRAVGDPAGTSFTGARTRDTGPEADAAEPLPPETLNGPEREPQAGADDLPHPPAPTADQQGGTIPGGRDNNLPGEPERSI